MSRRRSGGRTKWVTVQNPETGVEEKVEAEEMSFSPLQEPFLEYMLADGAKLRIRHVLMAVWKTPIIQDDGTPLYLFHMNQAHHVFPPPDDGGPLDYAEDER